MIRVGIAETSSTSAFDLLQKQLAVDAFDSPLGKVRANLRNTRI
jgi:hypothetical protein